MQTSIIRQRRIVLTPRTAQAAGLERSGGRAADVRRAASCSSKPPTTASAMEHFQIVLPEPLLSELRWASGDVVGMEPRNGGLVARRLEDPLAAELTLTGEDGLPVPPTG